MTGAELVDTIGLLAGTLWLAGAVYWQLVSTRHCPARYSGGMTVIGASLMFASSSLVLGSMPSVAVALAVFGNLLMLALAVATHLYLLFVLDETEDPPHGGHPS